MFLELLNIVKETGLSALIATHNMDLAGKMDRELLLKDGALTEQKTTLKIEDGKNFY